MAASTSSTRNARWLKPPLPQIRRMRTRIGPWGRVELEQLDLETRIRSLECEGDVLRFHARHAHVPGGKAAVDRRDVLLPEAEEREELDRRASIGHRDSNMIRIEEHLRPLINVVHSAAPLHRSARAQAR